jgi:4-amino-4-deoxy-L-arabinose transferase-like glycosyltransferase
MSSLAAPGTPVAALPQSSRDARALAWALLAALLLRLALLLSAGAQVDNDTLGTHGPSFVPLSYRELALAILHWDFSHDLGTRSPGYPAFMALNFRLFGVDNWQAIAAAQTLLALALFFSSYWLWSQIYGRGRAALLATATAVLEPVLLLSGNWVMSECLSAVLLLACLPLIVHAARQARPPGAAAAGLLVAWLALTRPAFEFLIPLFLAYLALRLGARRRSRAGLACMALFTLAAALPVAAWNAFNFARFGYFTPMTTQGFILTSHSEPILAKEPGRHPQYADVTEILERNKRPEGEGMAIWLAYPEIMQRRHLSFAGASRLMQQLSLEVFRDRPMDYARSAYRAFVRFWQAPDMTPPQWEKRAAFVLASRAYAILHAVGIVLFFCIMALDLARIRRWREPAILERLLLFSIVALVCLASTLPIAVENARYEIPLLPLMWGVVAASLVTNGPRLRELLARWQ